MKNWTSKDKKEMLLYILAIVSVIMIAAGLAFLIRNWYQHRVADDRLAESKQMQQQVVKQVEESDTQEAAVTDFEEKTEETVTDGETLGDYEKRQLGIKAHKSDANLTERIDFHILADLVENEDIAGWLYVPETNIDYVVMKGTEEEPDKYLWRDPYGDKSSTGSLFVMNTDVDGAEDDHEVIYGHRLKNHDLYFGALLPYREQNYGETHAVAYFYEKDKVTRYRLFSVVEGMETDSVYYYPYVRYTEEYQYLIDSVTENASYQLSDYFDVNDKMLVLSTCSGNGGGQPYRLYLVFEEDVFWEYE